jgi:hypothetical protein
VRVADASSSGLETWAKPGGGYVLTLTNDNHTGEFCKIADAGEYCGHICTDSCA